jgi:glycosyltransferase involved in cell wall biosynthesis
MSPKISVIMPNHNGEDFLPQALKSIDGQTLSGDNYEVVVVDDSSTDNSWGLIQSWARSKPNVIVHQNRVNVGPSVSRNRAIEFATGEYMALLDSDDALRSNALEESLSFFSGNPKVEYSYSTHRRVDAEGRFISERPGQEFSFSDLFHYNFVGHLKCFTKRLHDEIGGFFPNIPAEDWDHVIRSAIELGKGGIKRNPKMLYDYRWYPSNTSNTKVDELRKGIPRFLKKHLASLGVDAINVRRSHLTEGGYNYYDWDVRDA